MRDEQGYLLQIHHRRSLSSIVSPTNYKYGLHFLRTSSTIPHPAQFPLALIQIFTFPCSTSPWPAQVGFHPNNISSVLNTDLKRHFICWFLDFIEPRLSDNFTTCRHSQSSFNSHPNWWLPCALPAFAAVSEVGLRSFAVNALQWFGIFCV